MGHVKKKKKKKKRREKNTDNKAMYTYIYNHIYSKR